MELVTVGEIEFDGKVMPVYDDLDNPLFRLQDVAKFIGHASSNASLLLEACEDDEHLLYPVRIAGQIRKCNFVTESGLYNILAQSRLDTARLWRRVIFNQLIELRKEKDYAISDQFYDWDAATDSIWFDEDTGKMMYAVNVPGGDVEIRECDE